MSNETNTVPDWLQADMTALVAAEDQIQTAATAQATAQTNDDQAQQALDAANQVLEQAQQAGDAALNQLLNDWHSHMGPTPPPATMMAAPGQMHPGTMPVPPATSPAQQAPPAASPAPATRQGGRRSFGGQQPRTAR